MGKLHVSAVLVGLVLVVTGCQNKLHDENLQLHAQNRELQAQLSDAQGRLRQAPDPNETAAMRQQLADRDQKIKDLESRLREPTPGVSAPGIEGIETKYDAKAGTLTVTLPGDVLFESGQATIKSSAKATLDKVANALKKDYAGKPVYIDGHTDTDPINRTKEKWADNWDLAAERAHAVLAYLKGQNVDEKSFVLRSFGPYHPKANKSASRRVEIVVAVGSMQ